MKKIPFGKILMALGGLGLAALIVYLFLPKPVPVDFVAVERGDLLVTVDDDGKTRIKKWPDDNGTTYTKEVYRHVVTAPLDGYLLQIRKQPGEEVKEKEIIAVLRPKPPHLLDARTLAEANARVKTAAAAKQQANALVQKAKKTYDHAKQKYQRAQLLLPNAISQEDYDAAENKWHLAVEELNVAKSGAKVAEYEWQTASAALVFAQSIASKKSEDRRFKITSPLGGKVIQVFQEYEGMVTTGAKLLEVGDTKELEVVVDILSEDAVKIKPGARAFLDQWGGEKPLWGRVRRIEPGGFLKISALGVEEQRVNVIIYFDEKANEKNDPQNLRRRLGDAYRVQARIVVWEGANVIKVPAGALFRHKKKWAVYVFNDGWAQLRYVEVGSGNGLEREIKSGIKVGERVILHPSDQIKDGVGVYPR